MQASLYTAHYVDSIEKKIPGAAFGAVMVEGDKKSFRQLYGATDTYQTIWLKGVLAFFKNISTGTKAMTGLDITVNVYLCHPNVFTLATKIASVTHDLIGFDCDLEMHLDRKLRRKNLARRDNHDELMELIKVFLALHQQHNFKVKFQRCLPSVGNAGLAYQHAQLTMEKQVTQTASNVLPFKVATAL